MGLLAGYEVRLPSGYYVGFSFSAATWFWHFGYGLKGFGLVQGSRFLTRGCRA